MRPAQTPTARQTPEQKGRPLDPYRFRFAAAIVAIGVIVACMDYREFVFERTWPSSGAAAEFRISRMGFSIGHMTPRPHRWWPWHDRYDHGVEILGFTLCSRVRWFDVNRGVVQFWVWFGLPWWYLAALIFAHPLDRFGLRWANRMRVRAITRAQSRMPVCANCGYDLRASPRRCPECGLER